MLAEQVAAFFLRCRLSADRVLIAVLPPEAIALSLVRLESRQTLLDIIRGASESFRRA